MLPAAAHAPTPCERPPPPPQDAARRLRNALSPPHLNPCRQQQRMRQSPSVRGPQAARQAQSALSAPHLDQQRRRPGRAPGPSGVARHLAAPDQALQLAAALQRAQACARRNEGWLACGMQLEPAVPLPTPNHQPILTQTDPVFRAWTRHSDSFPVAACPLQRSRMQCTAKGSDCKRRGCATKPYNDDLNQLRNRPLHHHCTPGTTAGCAARRTDVQHLRCPASVAAGPREGRRARAGRVGRGDVDDQVVREVRQLGRAQRVVRRRVLARLRAAHWWSATSW